MTVVSGKLVFRPPSFFPDEEHCILFIDELRYPLGKGEKLPKIEELPQAKNYYISPLFLGTEKERMDLNQENIDYCIDYILNNPGWKLSVQLHKLLNIQ